MVHPLSFTVYVSLRAASTVSCLYISSSINQKLCVQAQCIHHVLHTRGITELTSEDLFEEMDLDCDGVVAFREYVRWRHALEPIFEYDPIQIHVLTQGAKSRNLPLYKREGRKTMPRSKGGKGEGVVLSSPRRVCQRNPRDQEACSLGHPVATQPMTLNSNGKDACEAPNAITSKHHEVYAALRRCFLEPHQSREVDFLCGS